MEQAERLDAEPLESFRRNWEQDLAGAPGNLVSMEEAATDGEVMITFWYKVHIF